MASLNEIKSYLPRNSSQLCKLTEMIGYGRGSVKQLQCNNGAFVSSLLEFFDDNPGAIDAVKEFIMENSDAYNLDPFDEPVDDDDDDDDDTEQGTE